MRNILLPFWFILILLPGTVSAQACCSAGTPIAGSLDLSIPEANTWRLTLSYEYNVLDDVIAGSNEIKGLRSRLSQSVLLDISYGYNSRISLTGLFTYLRQTRKLNGSNTTTVVSGAGDAALFLIYSILNPSIIKQRRWATGIGLKFPTGASDIKNGSVPFSADLQPGSGSWDGVFWTSFSQGYLPIRFSWFVGSTYRINGTNNRYKNTASGLGYHFGNEFLLNLGGVYSTKSLFNFSLQLRYRNTAIDRLGSLEVSNTGGNWIYLIHGININFPPLSVKLNGQLPIYRRLNDIQLTTSYRAGISLSMDLAGHTY